MKQISATLQPVVVVCIVYIDVDFQLLPSSANMCLCVHVRAGMCLRVARARACVSAFVPVWWMYIAHAQIC